MKKFLSAFLAFAMVLSMLWIPAVAETATVAEDVTSPTADHSVLPTYEGTGTQYMTDTNSDCLLLTVQKTTLDDFSAYLVKLQDEGYTKVISTNKILETSNKSIILQNGEYLINALFVPSNKSLNGVNEAKIAIEPLRNVDTKVFKASSAYDPTQEGSVESLLIQVGLDKMTVVDEENRTFTENSETNAMAYMYRLADGSFFVIDGGGNNVGTGDLDKNHALRLYHTMVKYNSVENGGKGGNIHISGWFITHPHTDHMGGFMAFTKTYVLNSGYGVTLDRVICNLPNVDTQTYINSGESMALSHSKLNTYNARLEALRARGTQIHKAHIGQKYYIANMVFEVLYTYDLFSPKLPDVFRTANNAYVSFFTEGNGRVHNSTASGKDLTNAFSIIAQATLNVSDSQSYKMIWTGDTTCFGIEAANAMYGAAMKSDFVQVPHHGHTQMHAGSESDDRVKYYHQIQVNHFFGMVKKVADTTVANYYETYLNDEGNTAYNYNVHYSKSEYGTIYNSDGSYGYVRAKYVLWPASAKESSNFDDIEVDRTATTGSNSRLTTWSPIIHLQDEARAAGGDAYLARYYLTIFNLNDLAVEDADGDSQKYIPTIDKTVITPWMQAGEGPITSAADFAEMSANGEYYLANDITITNPTGPLHGGTFAGKLDGRGHTITIQYSSANADTPLTTATGFLFYELSGTVQNLTIDGARISLPNESGQYGILARRATGTAVVDNVHVLNAKIKDTNTASGNVGGFFGDANGTSLTITNSSFAGVISNDANKSHNVGGFLGRAGTGTGNVRIENCTVSGSIAGGTTGGFIGTATTTGKVTLVDCVSFATLTGKTQADAFAANIAANSTVTVTVDKLFSPTVLYGARIRLAAGENALTEGGIRYDISLGRNAKEIFDAYKAAGYTVKLGSLMVRTDKLEAAGLDFTTATKAKLDAAGVTYSDSTPIAYEDMLASGKLRNKGGWYYTAAIYNLSPEQYDMDINCIGYVVIEKGGVSQTIYSSFEQIEDEEGNLQYGNTRSVQYVASRALDDHLSDAPDRTDYTAYLDLLYAYSGREDEREEEPGVLEEENADDQTHDAGVFRPTV